MNINIHSKIGGAKPPKQHNPHPAGLLQALSKLGAWGKFHVAMRRRIKERPFDRISAYKIRESRDNIEHELQVVQSIRRFLCTPRSYRNDFLLVSCTPQDKAQRLKNVPHIIVRELGENLIPAVQALYLEGVPIAHISAHVATLMPLLDKLWKDCDAAQASNAASVQYEYSALKNGASLSEQICHDALHIADAAMDFAKKHGVLR